SIVSFILLFLLLMSPPLSTLSLFPYTTLFRSIFFFYLFLYRKFIFENNAMLLLVLLAMSLICVGSALVYNLENVSAYIVPVAIADRKSTRLNSSHVSISYAVFCLKKT